MKIEGLNLGFYYIKWYDTRNQGGHINAYDQVLSTDLLGRLAPDWPGGADLAFIAEKINVLSPGNQNLSTDTLLCWEDTLFPQLTYKTDSAGLWNYVWDVNGTIYNQWHPIIPLPQTGNYQVMLVITDTTGNSDTIRQTFFKPECDTVQRSNIIFHEVNLQQKISKIEIIPNPNNGVFTVKLPIDLIDDLFLINTSGEIIRRIPNSGGNTEIQLNLETQPSGIYAITSANKSTRYVTRFAIIH